MYIGRVTVEKLVGTRFLLVEYGSLKGILSEHHPRYNQTSAPMCFSAT
jgi:hypothetical protein